MTTLVCDFIDIIGEPIDGVASLSTGEVRPDYSNRSVKVPHPVSETVVAGQATFSNVRPGKAVLTVHWEGRSATFRFTVPDTDSIALIDAVAGMGLGQSELDEFRAGIAAEFETTRNVVIEAAESAQDAAASATSSASAAASSATAADDSQVSAASSATAASQSATSASTSATNAAASATSASTHEDTSLDAAAAAITAAVSIVEADTTTSLMTWTADAVGGRNLIQNGDFRLPGQSGSWIKEPPTMTDPDGTKFARQNYGWGLQFAADVEPGDYVISMDVREPSGNTRSAVRASINLMDDDGETVVHRNVNAYHLSTSFERREITFTVPAGVTNLTTYLLNQDANPGNAYIDFTRIKFERGPVATPWTPAPEDSVQSLLEGDPLSSLPSPFLAHDPALALRVDNSVGTRVFVGDTMIYGDTGRREVSSWFQGTLDTTEVTWTKIFLRRVNERVYLWGSAKLLTEDKTLAIIPDVALAPDTQYGVIGTVGTVGVRPNMGHIHNGGGYPWLQILGPFSVGNMISFNLSYEARFKTWPTSLPGTPA